MQNDYFYTFYEYMKKDGKQLSASMEDYIEMIYRLSEKNGTIRINELSQSLNIKPSSATKMAKRLSDRGYIKYEKYSVIRLEEKGNQIGALLLKRHMILEEFMKTIGVKDSEILEETEKIEHMLSGETTNCFEMFVAFMKDNPDIAIKYNEFRENCTSQVYTDIKVE